MVSSLISSLVAIATLLVWHASAADQCHDVRGSYCTRKLRKCHKARVEARCPVTCGTMCTPSLADASVPSCQGECIRIDGWALDVDTWPVGAKVCRKAGNRPKCMLAGFSAGCGRRSYQECAWRGWPGAHTYPGSEGVTVITRRGSNVGPAALVRMPLSLLSASSD